MINLDPKTRLTFLTQSLVDALQPLDVADINVYVIIDPAGEHRNKVAGLLTASFVPMLGIFPKEISDAVSETNEEPQLMLLDETSNELLGKVLAEDVSALQFLYSPLCLEALSEQLKPQLHIIVAESEQTGFMRYWDPRVFITLPSILTTVERKQAFMGNICLVGFIDEEVPDKFRVSYVRKNEDENSKEEIDALSMYYMELDPVEPITNPFDYEVLDYIPFATPMIYTAWDAEVFAKRRSQKQIRQMARLLVTHPLAQEKGLKIRDSLVAEIDELVVKASQDYHMDDVDAIYQFVLASYILGVGFEKSDSELEEILKDKDYSNNYKKHEVELCLEKENG